MQVNIGDLVKVDRTGCNGWHCECFFCATNSNGIGLIMGPAPREGWAVQFDTGQWRLYPVDFENGDAEVINHAS